MSAPRIVELGTIRQEHTALRDPELLASPRRSVPEPGDLSVAEYGDLLAPPQPDRFAPVESLDLFYPAMDRLTLVHRLRCSDIKTTGQWLQVETAAAVGRYVEGAEERRALSARVHMARQYLERWRIGRGRPMTAADLEASGLVSETFIAPMAECLRSHQGQAQALLDAIDDKSIKRFRSSNRDELEDYLLGEGFLDPRDALSSLELEAELLADLEPEIEAGTLQASVLRAFVSMMDRTCHTA